jgi:hypothetical protein
MYIQAPNRGYTHDGQQFCRRAPFLLLLQNGDWNSQVYGVVRTVALRQCGHWMMGKARILDKSYTVSGSYGNDGLTLSVDTIPPDAKPLPDELREAWNRGGGWNSAGSEAEAMAEWARKELLR